MKMIRALGAALCCAFLTACATTGQSVPDLGRAAVEAADMTLMVVRKAVDTELRAGTITPERAAAAREKLDRAEAAVAVARAAAILDDQATRRERLAAALALASEVRLLVRPPVSAPVARGVHPPQPAPASG